MKIILLAASLFFAATSPALAGTVASTTSPVEDTLLAAQIERVEVLQKASFNEPAIVLVQVDNGGSSDISAMMSPSRAYIGIHLDGEMFDINGSYLVVSGLTKIRDVDFDSKKKIVDVKFEYCDETLKTRVAYTRIFLAPALKEVSTAQSDALENYVLKASIAVQRTEK